MKSIENLTPQDWAFIKESLQYTKIKFENYTQYPDQDFKNGRIADAVKVLAKVGDIVSEIKAVNSSKSRL